MTRTLSWNQRSCKDPTQPAVMPSVQTDQASSPREQDRSHSTLGLHHLLLHRRLVRWLARALYLLQSHQSRASARAPLSVLSTPASALLPYPGTRPQMRPDHASAQTALQMRQACCRHRSPTSHGSVETPAASRTRHRPSHCSRLLSTTVHRPKHHASRCHRAPTLAPRPSTVPRLYHRALTDHSHHSKAHQRHRNGRPSSPLNRSSTARDSVRARPPHQSRAHPAHPARQARARPTALWTALDRPPYHQCHLSHCIPNLTAVSILRPPAAIRTLTQRPNSKSSMKTKSTILPRHSTHHRSLGAALPGPEPPTARRKPRIVLRRGTLPGQLRPLRAQPVLYRRLRSRPLRFPDGTICHRSHHCRPLYWPPGLEHDLSPHHHNYHRFLHSTTAPHHYNATSATSLPRTRQPLLSLVPTDSRARLMAAWYRLVASRDPMARGSARSGNSAKAEECTGRKARSAGSGVA